MTTHEHKLISAWNRLKGFYPSLILKISLNIIALAFVASLVSTTYQSANLEEKIEYAESSIQNWGFLKGDYSKEVRDWRNEYSRLRAIQRQSFVERLWDNIVDIGAWFLIPLAVLVLIPVYRLTVTATQKITSESIAMTPFQRYSLLLYALIALTLIVIGAVLIF